MHPAEVVDGNVNRGRGGAVFELSREPQGQASKSLHEGANREVATLDVGRAYRAEVAYALGDDCRLPRRCRGTRPA